MQSPLFSAGFAFTESYACQMHRPLTYVYIDGFNLYYGCFKDRNRPGLARYKWLDLEKFCDFLFPKNDVVKIKYYTADVSSRPPDNRQGDRQKAYLNALSRLPRVEIVKGHFLGPKVVRMPLCDDNGRYQGKTITVLKTEEKGSDVNLAVDLLHDGVQNLYECAIVVSNDSDLLSPIRIVRREYGKKIGLASPHTKASIQLSQNVDFHLRVTEKALSLSQLPDHINIGATVISKPDNWR
ncbi:MAG: NYN domain-containing protein [Armatimonadetes bacterium]|nr:NYN domain-containing protein [Armatimonadota bacterium]